MSDDLVFVPEVEARARLRDRVLRERMVLPPYPALGLGRLRVLRVDENEEHTTLVCGYEGYQKL